MIEITQARVLWFFGLVLLVIGGFGCIAFLLSEGAPASAATYSIGLISLGAVAGTAGNMGLNLEKQIKELRAPQG